MSDLIRLTDTVALVPETIVLICPDRERPDSWTEIHTIAETLLINVEASIVLERLGPGTQPMFPDVKMKGLH